MVSKCANPGCSSPFLYLHEGKLFRVELMVEKASGHEPRPGQRRVEFYWLCDHCAGSMTVVYQDGVGVQVQPLARGSTAA